jgi:hypothetical protein
MDTPMITVAAVKMRLFFIESLNQMSDIIDLKFCIPTICILLKPADRFHLHKLKNSENNTGNRKKTIKPIKLGRINKYPETFSMKACFLFTFTRSTLLLN